MAESITMSKIDQLKQELQDYQDIAVLAFSEAKEPRNQEHYNDAMREWLSACERIKELNLLIEFYNNK